MRIIISHPARQQSVYQWPLAIQEAGIDVKFVTGIYYKPHAFPYSLVKHLPERWREAATQNLLKRQIPGLELTAVNSFPWFEFLLRPFGKTAQWNRAHDLLVGGMLLGTSGVRTPTIVHAFQESCLYTLRAAKKRGIKTVVEVTNALSRHRIVAEEYQRLGLSPVSDRPSKVEMAEVLEADYVVGQSRFTVSSLLEYGVPASKIILQPLGVDTKQFQPSVRQGPKSIFRAVFVGQLSIRKGLHHLLEAWKLLRLPNAELLLLGNPIDSHGRDLLAQYEGTFRWPGFVSHGELRHIYRDSDIFVFPSLAEGSANATYEALASGLPSVVTANAGSVVRDGIEGFEVECGNIEALKTAIERLYRDADLREQMGVAARRRAERYSWGEFGRRLVRMYEHICNSVPASSVLDMSVL